MDHLPLWSDTEPELDPTQMQDHAELDNISPSLIVSSLTDMHANYLLDDLHSDYVMNGCERGTVALDYAPPTQQHSHGLYPCSFSSDTCPLNSFSRDPLFGEDNELMTPETAVTLRSASRQRVGSPDTPGRPVGRRPLRHVVKPAPGGAAYREPPPPYPGLTRQERTDQSQFYGVSPARRLGISERSVPRLKVVRRVTTPTLVRHSAPCPAGSPSAAGRRPGRLTPTGQTESQHTKPSLSYVNLITLSLLNSETGSLRCNEIYDFLQRVFPYFREISSKTWKNDTRHALSSNQSSSNFCKAPETKDPSGAANRGALWMAKPEKVAFLHEHLSKTYHKFADNIRESMENPELYDELLRGLTLYGGLDPMSPCDQSPTIGSTTDSSGET